MSNGYLGVLEKKRGPTSMFQFSISTLEHDNKEIKSNEFEIANLATVRLEVKHSSGIIFNISLAYKKHEMVKNSSVNMFVTCEVLKFSTKMPCPEIWSSVCLGGFYRTNQYKVLINDHSRTVINAIAVLSITVFRDENIISNPLLYEDQDFTDFELMAADGSLAVHKNCLATRSAVFRRMFAGEWKETGEGGVEIKDVKKQTLQDMKDFIYMGRLPDDGLRPLIVVAKKYMITDLVEACAKKLAETVLPEDLYSLHELAGQNLPELSCAIAELTPDKVIHEAYEIKMTKRNTALTTDIK